ncbi:MAG: amino acid racemase [Actinomycetota bacterium]|nr:amino acid racemase [Actinomycetota bacterium]
MRTIGLLGGMSWQSTAIYYRLLNERVAERVGGDASADLVLRSVDFAEIHRLQIEGEWHAAGELLAAAARGVEAAGAEVLGLATNTMHLVAGQITAATTIPFVHIVDAVAEAAGSFGARRLALLGTGFTMRSTLYQDRLAGRGVEILVPSPAAREVVDRVMFDELVHGVITPAARAAYVEVVDTLARDGAEAVVLGCTEIGLLLRPQDVDLPLIDTASVHVDALLAASLSTPALEVVA